MASWRSTTKIAGSGSESGSLSQRHGSADPDLHQICHGSGTLVRTGQVLVFNCCFLCPRWRRGAWRRRVRRRGGGLRARLRPGPPSTRTSSTARQSCAATPPNIQTGSYLGPLYSVLIYSTMYVVSNLVWWFFSKSKWVKERFYLVPSTSIYIGRYMCLFKNRQLEYSRYMDYRYLWF